MPNSKKGLMHPRLSESDMVEPLNTIDPYDMSNKFAMINNVPAWLKGRMLDSNVIKYLSMSQEDAEKLIVPTRTIRQLRSAFWYEYERTFRSGGRHQKNDEKKMALWRICSGICTTKFFETKVLKSDGYLSWIMRPPIDYHKSMQDSLEQGLERVRDILTLPLFKDRFNKNGEVVGQEPNVSVANIILKTVAFLDLRIKGAIPQQINQYTERKSLNYNVKSGNEMNQVIDMSIATVRDLDKSIESIQHETVQLVENPVTTNTEHKILIGRNEAEIEEHAREHGFEPTDDELLDIPMEQYDPKVAHALREGYRKPANEREAEYVRMKDSE